MFSHDQEPREADERCFLEHQYFDMTRYDVNLSFFFSLPLPAVFSPLTIAEPARWMTRQIKTIKFISINLRLKKNVSVKWVRAFLYSMVSWQRHRHRARAPSQWRFSPSFSPPRGVTPWSMILIAHIKMYLKVMLL